MSSHAYAEVLGDGWVELPFRNYLARFKTKAKHSAKAVCKDIKAKKHKMTFTEANPNFKAFSAGAAAILALPLVSIVGAFLQGVFS